MWSQLQHRNLRVHREMELSHGIRNPQVHMENEVALIVMLLWWCDPFSLHQEARTSTFSDLSLDFSSLLPILKLLMENFNFGFECRSQPHSHKIKQKQNMESPVLEAWRLHSRSESYRLVFNVRPHDTLCESALVPTCYCSQEVLRFWLGREVVTSSLASMWRYVATLYFTFILQEVLQFWLDRGADGFRVDAVDALYETDDLAQNEPRSYRENVFSVSTPSTLLLCV